VVVRGRRERTVGGRARIFGGRRGGCRQGITRRIRRIHASRIIHGKQLCRAGQGKNSGMWLVAGGLFDNSYATYRTYETYGTYESHGTYRTLCVYPAR